MDVKIFTNPSGFLAAAGGALMRDEARYGLILGLARVVEQNPHRYGTEDPWFCAVHTGKKINATAMRTPPYLVSIAYFGGDKRAIAEKLVEAITQKWKTVPGMVAEVEQGKIFADIWCKKCDAKIVYTQAQRIYRLVKVNDVLLAPGKLRQATMEDKELAAKWHHAFSFEAMSGTNNTPVTDITPALESGSIFFWEDGKPVSMAVSVRPTDRGMTVGGVYTPPEMRGRGYATSCVAELSRYILQSGKEFCMLYTDLANPTSNSIYKKIGYREVCDSVMYRFENARPA